MANYIRLLRKELEDALAKWSGTEIQLEFNCPSCESLKARAKELEGWLKDWTEKSERQTKENEKLKEEIKAEQTNTIRWYDKWKEDCEGKDEDIRRYKRKSQHRRTLLMRAMSYCYNNEFLVEEIKKELSESEGDKK